MARSATAATLVDLEPAAALALWTDVDRWPSFVEGFARVVEQDPGWPAEGARLAWESGAGGRGRVTERVVEHGPDSFVTQVFEDRLSGTQRLTVAEQPDGARVDLTLEYELTSDAPLSALGDVLFIRRALRDALGRTLRRYAIEAEEDAGLRDRGDSLAEQPTKEAD
jgi:hypothetical protein